MGPRVMNWHCTGFLPYVRREYRAERACSTRAAHDRGSNPSKARLAA